MFEKVQMGGQQSTSTTRESTLDIQNQIKQQGRTLPDGTYVLVVDKQGNPQNPVSSPFASMMPESQFAFKLSGLRDDIKDNLKIRFWTGDVIDKNEAEKKIKRLQILLALLVVVVLYLIAIRRCIRA